MKGLKSGAFGAVAVAGVTAVAGLVLPPAVVTGALLAGVASYLGLNGVQTTNVDDIRVVPDATQVSAINPGVKPARR